MRFELGLSQVKVQQYALSWEVSEERNEDLARWKLRWKLIQICRGRIGGGGGKRRGKRRKRGGGTG